jgi:uncharacterized protein (DUF433 family)
MAALDWSQCPAVESVPGKLHGAWVFRGTRMPVSAVFENLEAGATVEEVAEWFHLTRQQVTCSAGVSGAEPRRTACAPGGPRLQWASSLTTVRPRRSAAFSQSTP